MVTEAGFFSRYWGLLDFCIVLCKFWMQHVIQVNLSFCPYRKQQEQKTEYAVLSTGSDKNTHSSTQKRVHKHTHAEAHIVDQDDGVFSATVLYRLTD